VGFLTGLAATIAASLGALFYGRSPLADGAALLALNVLAYLALAFGYFNFINLNIASLRIRMLQEILEANGRISRAQLLCYYNADEVARLRIARLVRGGHLRERDGRLYSGKATRFLWVAWIFEALHWIILGHQVAPKPPSDASFPAANIEGAP
jgi:hypothetical protein